METAARRDQLVQSASALVPALKERADHTEQLRHVPQSSVGDLISADLIRVGNPERFGGLGLDIDTTFTIAEELGRGCGSTAWCYSVWSAHQWFLGYFPEQGQEEYFSGGPDTLCCSALNSSNGTAEQVDGGFRVSGRWRFSTGSNAAHWVLVACRTVPDGTDIWLLLPRSDYAVIDTWFAAGLRGSGSNDIVVDDAFVPSHLSIDPRRAGDSDRQGWDLHQRESYRVPLKMFVSWALVAPVIGMAQGAVDDVIETWGASPGPGPGRLTTATSLHLRLAQASAEVDTARRVLHADVDEILERSKLSGSPFPTLDRLRYVRDAAFSVTLCVQAVDRLYAAAGARAIMAPDPLQRFHRDVNAAAHHASLGWDAAAEQFGRRALSPEAEG